MNRRRWYGVMGGLLVGMAVAGTLSAQPQGPEPAMPIDETVPAKEFGSSAGGSELHAGRWQSGGGMGLLWSTPDGNAFGINGNADYFVTDNVSVGPLVQVGVTDDLTQVGISGQGKYWIEVPGTNGRGKVNFQSGIGFVHADFLNDDTSWLVPLGMGYDYALNSSVDLTATALVNFTDLHTGAGTNADVMPGFMFGLKF